MCALVREGGISSGEQLVWYFICTPSRCGLLSGIALTGTVCCASQRPAMSICFSSHGAANNIDADDQGVSNGHSL